MWKIMIICVFEIANQLLVFHLLYFVSVRCLYCNKQNNTWLLGDMEFLFSCSTWYLKSEYRERVRYPAEHSKRNSISLCVHLWFSIYCLLDLLQISWNIQFLASYDRNKLQRRSSSFQLGCGINSIIHCLWCQTQYDLGFTWRQFVRNESSLWQISCNASAELEIEKDTMHWFSVQYLMMVIFLTNLI